MPPARRHASHDLPIVRIGPWLVRPPLGLLVGPTGLKRLRPRDADALVALARAAPDAVSLAELKRRAWGGDHVVDAAVTNAIVRLRAAFGDEAGRPRVIERVGRGYRLVPAITTVAAPPPAVQAWRGLTAYGLQDAGLFAGRHAWVERALESLRPALNAGRGGLLRLVGPNGSGKTSLLQAGLRPAIEREWPSLACCSLDGRVDDPEAWPRLPPTLLLLDPLDASLAPPSRVAAWLDAIVARVDAGPCCAIVALREAQAGQAARLRPGTAWSRAEGLLQLGVPDPDELLSIVVQPAWWCGREFDRAPDDPGGLPARWVAEAVRLRHPLPVLGLALHELAAQGNGDAVLRSDAADAGDALGACWAAHAERCWAGLDAAPQAALDGLVLALTVGAGRCPEPVGAPAAQALVAGFVEADLLMQRHDGTETWLEAADDRWLRSWPRAAATLARHDDLLLQWRHLAEAARLWRESGRAEAFALAPGALAGLAGLLDHAGAYLLPLHRQLIEASRQQQGSAAEVNALALDLLRWSDPRVAQGRSPTARDLLDTAYERLHAEPAPAVAPGIAEAMGRAYLNLGEYTRAERLLQRAVEAAAAAHGDAAPATATARLALGKLEYTRGRYAEALAIYDGALAGLEAAPDSPALAQACNDQGEALVALGRYADALRAHRRALELRRRLLGPVHGQVGESLNNLAGVLRVAGDPEAAETHYRQALQIQRAAYGAHHPDVAAVASNLAILLTDSGRLDEARALHDEALALRRRVFGPEHPITANSLHNLAALLVRVGDPAAEALLRESIALHLRLFGPGHMGTASARNNLGMLRLAGGAPAEAEALFRAAADEFARAQGADHPNVGLFRVNLGRALDAQGRHADAATCLRQAVDLLANRLEPSHPRLVAAREALEAAQRTAGAPRPR